MRAASPPGCRSSASSRGDRVAVMMPTRAEFLYAWFGILGAGAIEVPIHDAARGPGIAYILETTGARALIVDEEHVEHVAGHIGLGVEHVIVRGDAGELTGAGLRVADGEPRRHAGRAQAERSRLDPLHRRHDRPAQGRRAPAQPQPEPGSGRRRARPLHGGRRAVLRLPALPRQREVHDRARGAGLGRARGDQPPLLGQPLLGDLPPRGRDRVQRPGRDAAHPAQAARERRRPRQHRARGRRRGRRDRPRRAVRAALRPRRPRRLRDDRDRPDDRGLLGGSAARAPPACRRRGTRRRSSTPTTSRSRPASPARSSCGRSSRS